MLARRRRGRAAEAAGFTLIELMIAVAIVGVLAAVAIPRYEQYVLRARQTEGLTLIAMAKNAEYAYFALNDCFLDLAPVPVTIPSVVKLAWDATPSGHIQNTCFDRSPRSFYDLAVQPNHPFVYYQYECRARFSGTSPGNTDDFTCSAWGDLDGDGSMYELVFGTDFDNDGATVASAHNTISYFPNDPVRVSVGIY